MIRRAFLLLFFFAASAAHASWWPLLGNNYISLQTGETTSTSVRAQWSGLTDYGFVPWKFTSSDPSVAVVEGGLDRLGEAGTLKITAVGPGTAQVFLTTGGGPYGTIVVTRDDTPLQIAATPAAAGKPVKLTAVNPPPMSTSWWYLGRTGDQSRPLGVGHEVTFTPSAAGVTYVWVWSVTPNAATSVELALDVEPSTTRRRAVRR
ncbi:MAG TPA: hypothetical protein VHK90_02630 [Thermoanaerobaculia bacterium]|nr:hypothetical protein [Thermoanaerobaculia bacterium]